MAWQIYDGAPIVDVRAPARYIHTHRYYTYLYSCCRNIFAINIRTWLGIPTRYVQAEEWQTLPETNGSGSSSFYLQLYVYTRYIYDTVGRNSIVLGVPWWKSKEGERKDISWDLQRLRYRRSGLTQYQVIAQFSSEISAAVNQDCTREAMEDAILLARVSIIINADPKITMIREREIEEQWKVLSNFFLDSEVPHDSTAGFVSRYFRFSVKIQLKLSWDSERECSLRGSRTFGLKRKWERKERGGYACVFSGGNKGLLGENVINVNWRSLDEV